MFFVISGYLITEHLLRRHRQHGGISIAHFWAARARRLLPAALTVLLVSVALTLLWAPPALRAQYLQSVIASALYVENWQLAANAIDYLGQENAPPIAQHYWSLSVEEQFYLIWPLLILAAGALAARMRSRSGVVLGVALSTLAVFSLSLSIWWSANEPGLGYFSTISRMWEFAIGAAVALLPAMTLRSRSWRGATWFGAWGSLACIVFIFGADTTFPGPSALWPTLAAAALIAVGPIAPFRLLHRAQSALPIQWVGDHSYGIYLWHWPLIVIAPWVLGAPPSFVWNVGILATSFLAAAITKKVIEDPIRFGRTAIQARPGRVAWLTAAAMVVVLAAAIASLSATSSTGSARPSAELADPTRCHGASAMLSPTCADALTSETPVAALTPAITGLYDDTGGAYRCYDQQPSGNPTSCTVASGGPSATRVALVGDSHAAMLIPALEVIARERGWSVDVWVGRGCKWYADTPETDCAARHDEIDEKVLSGEYDLLVETWRNGDSDDADAARVSDALSSRWSTAWKRGTAVAAVIDNPAMPRPAEECLLSTEVFTADSCSFPRPDAALATDPLRTAAERSPATPVDLTSAYCHETCPVVVGGVVIYRDSHHITASFSTTLSSALGDRLDSALASRG
ncbi:acyltransferase family protein [Microbacterium aquimaris]